MQEQLDLKLFGERLRTARKEHELSQAQLGERVGADAPWISNLEKGRQSGLAANTVYRLARGLGVSADYLLGLTDDPTPARRARRKRPATGADPEADDDARSSAELMPAAHRAWRRERSLPAVAAAEEGR